MFARDIGIDLGTANVLIHVKGKGIVLNEPSVVALDKNSGKVLAVGEEARRMVGRTPGNIVAIRPLKDGVIADFEVTEAMLKHFINKLNVKGLFSKPRMLICCPTNITSVEQKAIKEAAEKSGGKHVFLEEEPKVAAIGAGMDIFQPSGNMVVDIGGGTTDIAVISMGDIVTASSIKMAGDKFDLEILNYIKKEYKLLIGERTAEDIKINIGGAYPREKEVFMDVKGRNLVSGLPVNIKVSSEEIVEALEESVAAIADAVHGVLEKTPPELASDIANQGIVMTGGGALLWGFNKLIEKRTGIPVYIAEDAVSCVAK